MGKRYLVEEIDTESTIGVVIISIIAFGLIVLINYVIFQSLGENIIYLGNFKKIDPEVLGIFCGIILSFCIGLVSFIIKWIEGIISSIKTSSKILLGTTILTTWIGSIILPVILYYIIYHTIEFEWVDLIKTIVLNFILLLIASPLIALFQLLIIIPLGTILSFLLYKIIYILKTPRIRNTICWQKIVQWNKKTSIRNNIRTIKLYPDKIEFYNLENQLQDTISFKQLGYSDLKPIMKLTLIDSLSRWIKTSLIIKDKYLVTSTLSLTIENAYLKNQQQKENISRVVNQKKYNRKQQKSIKSNLKQKKKEYKAAIRKGKDW